MTLRFTQEVTALQQGMMWKLIYTLQSILSVECAMEMENVTSVVVRDKKGNRQTR